ncbi:MAG TPA: hypothetical protein VE010_22130 [Thermoanaerobaculia bacterium]|nr:hypothetical protein [Thermoanaerobaculia bacterium]
MKRLALLLLLALPVTAAEKWFEAYDRGIAAVSARNYRTGAEALQKAIAEMPNEAVNVRARNSLITYVPHFWLGIAKLNLGDADGALREWRISEEQGAIARTDYYARMKDWVARAQAEKQRSARDAASGSKKAADVAISRALETQLDALSAGGDRSESYLAAQKKLQHAREQFQKGGTDVNAYKAAEQTATQAKALFASALEEGKKLRAARAAVPKTKPAKTRVIAGGAAGFSPPKVAPKPTAVAPQAASNDDALVPVLTEEEVTRQIAEQEARRRVIEGASAHENAARPELQAAYRAFARGELAVSDRLLTDILATQADAEALLLRGCARYTTAMLSRTPDAMLVAAANDFRAALARDGALRLDARTFSPKLVAFFENVRNNH